MPGRQRRERVPVRDAQRPGPGLVGPPPRGPRQIIPDRVSLGGQGGRGVQAPLRHVADDVEEAEVVGLQP